MQRHRQSTRAGRSAAQVARGLGWLSIGLGLAELLAPRAVARATGLRGREGTLRLYGLREMATGVGLLTARDPAPWLWARLGGDAVDLATLATAARPSRGSTAVAMAAVAGVTALDVATARVLRADRRHAAREVRDYSDRRGLPLPPHEMRGLAREDFRTPRDMRVPEPLRPFATA